MTKSKSVTTTNGYRSNSVHQVFILSCAAHSAAQLGCFVTSIIVSGNILIGCFSLVYAVNHEWVKMLDWTPKNI